MRWGKEKTVTAYIGGEWHPEETTVIIGLYINAEGCFDSVLCALELEKQLPLSWIVFILV